MIQDCILVEQSRQKSNADKMQRPLKFEVGEFLMLKISSMNGVKHFGRKGKLAPRYTGAFKIVGKVGTVSYCLKLPDELNNGHGVFHISMLRKHLRNKEQQCVMHVPELQLQPDITTEETLVCILAIENKKLRNKLILLVKVQWSRHGAEEAYWKHEEDMHRDYSQLFEEKV